MPTLPDTNDTSGDLAYPQAWIWKEHGLRVDGGFVRTDRASSEYGSSPIIVLDVDGVERSVWLNVTALVSKFRDELRRRKARRFEPGERITIQRAAEKKTSAAGRDYWPFAVRFHDAPQMDDADVLEVDDGYVENIVEQDIEDEVAEETADEIPF